MKKPVAPENIFTLFRERQHITVIGICCLFLLILLVFSISKPTAGTIQHVAVRYCADALFQQMICILKNSVNQNSDIRSFFISPSETLDLQNNPEIVDMVKFLSPDGSLKLKQCQIQFIDKKSFLNPNPLFSQEYYGIVKLSILFSVSGIEKHFCSSYDMKMVSIMPPAPDYTLFINSPLTDEDELNKGGMLICHSGGTGKIRINGDKESYVNLSQYDVIPAGNSLVPSPNIPDFSVGGFEFNSGFSYDGYESAVDSSSPLFSCRTRLFGSPLCSEPVVIEGKVMKRWFKLKYDGTGLQPVPFSISSAPYNNSSDSLSMNSGTADKSWPLAGEDFFSRATVVQKNFHTKSSYISNISGITFCANAEISPAHQPLFITGRGMIVAVNSFNIYRSLKYHDTNPFCSLILLGENTMKILNAERVESYIHSARGCEISPEKTVEIYGNLSVNTLNKENIMGTLSVIYNSGITRKNTDEFYYITFSQAPSSYLLEEPL